MKRVNFFLLVSTLIFSCLGCEKSKVKAALDSDANGFYCPSCKGKFYTERDLFIYRCPDCKKTGVHHVLGYVCEKDKHATLGPRNPRGMACEKCGTVTTSLMIPREADLKAWGATQKTKAEVPTD